MVTTLGRRVVLLVATVLMALMMALPTASSDPGNGKGFGQGQGGGDFAHSDNGKHTVKGGGKSNNPHSGSMACANADTPANQLTQTAAEEAVLCLINEQRVANGVPALTLNLKLRAAARLHAQDARTIKWWAGGGSNVHTNPVTGSTPESRIREAAYCPEELAPQPPTNENVYFSSYSGGVNYQGGTTPQAAVTWWINNPVHRNTLLDPAYRESGVAVVLGIVEKGTDADRVDGGAIFVQTFGGCAVPESPDVGQG